MHPPARLSDLLPHPLPQSGPGPAPSHQVAPGLTAVAPAAFICLKPVNFLERMGSDRSMSRQEPVVSSSRGLLLALQLPMGSLAFGGAVSVPSLDAGVDPTRHVARFGLRNTSGHQFQSRLFVAFYL